MCDPAGLTRARQRLIEAIDPLARATRALFHAVQTITRQEAQGRVAATDAAALRRRAVARFAGVVSLGPVAASRRVRR